MKTMRTRARASSIFHLTIISLVVFSVQSQKDTSYDDCSPFKCGNFTFSFPFSSSLTSGHCGLPGYQITCEDPSSSPKLLLSSRLYQVKDFYPSAGVITVVNTELIKDLNSGSCESFYNLSISNDNYMSPITLPPGNVNLTFYKCPNSLPLSREFIDKVVINVSCSDDYELYVWRNGSQYDPPTFTPVLTPIGCHPVLVPVSSVSSLFLNGDGDQRKKLTNTLANGFPLSWPEFDSCDRCQNRSGRCGYDGSSKEIVCFCKGNCNEHRKSKGKPLIIGVATGSCSIFVLIAVLLLVFRKRTPQFFKNIQKTEDIIKVQQFIKTYRSALLTNYSYNDVKKMTNGFKEKLGAGGYGSVYKGKFPDGRPVAVKILEKKSDNISQDFISEVATIGRIHHVNVINLLGFCCDSSTRALIYEFMPNGSLGDLLSKEDVNLSLGLLKLFEIALSVAHAIEYLHNGCELRILHLDIKPHNVLLDQNFNPKISDFGLAKVHSRNKSVVTITSGARGTIGYIAPEIFMRNLGSPSHKSDVYSYGMLLLEMVGGRKHEEPITSEAYFPDWIYDKLNAENDLKHSDSLIEEDEACIVIARKMVMVGLWCIQINPRDRPSMTRVVEMLSGYIEAIAMPPKPFFLSPPRVQLENENICNVDGESDGESDTTSVLPLKSDMEIRTC